jgi:hypothetical protein
VIFYETLNKQYRSLLITLSVAKERRMSTLLQVIVLYFTQNPHYICSEFKHGHLLFAMQINLFGQWICAHYAFSTYQRPPYMHFMFYKDKQTKLKT